MLDIDKHNINNKLSINGSSNGNLKRRRSRRLASTRGIKWRSCDLEILTTEPSYLTEHTGWIRLYAGPHIDSTQDNSSSSLVELSLNTTVGDLSSLLCLPPELTICVQIGGGESKRLDENTTPLGEQNEYLKGIGYKDESRRNRMGIDPDLSYLIRFHLGPAVPFKSLDGYKKCGSVNVLKGLVFPQWKLRPVAVFGSKLFVYPGSLDGAPEIIELRSARIARESQTRGGRQVLHVEPTAQDERGHTPKHIFFGFTRSWERDLWFIWLLEATTTAACPIKLDLSGSSLHQLPDNALLLSPETTAISNNSDCGTADASPTAAPAAVCTGLQELDLANNRLADRSALESLSRHQQTLRSLRLSANAITTIPHCLFNLKALVFLDLSDNNIVNLHKDLLKLKDLEELRLDRNEFSKVPEIIFLLPKLLRVHLAENKITDLTKMRATGLSDYPGDNGSDSERLTKTPLAKVNLRANQLKGCITLGNYGVDFQNLTHLDVSENRIETLDLSALDKLEVLQCSRNQIVEISMNGKSITSIIAGNNELKKINVNPVPAFLQHIDLSHNALENLPQWISACPQLRCVFATHNNLHTLPEHMFCSEQTNLRTLQIGYNKLTSLPSLPRQLPLQELFLQNNSISSLPENFFTAFNKLCVLNLSNNRLCQLPSVKINCISLQKLYITANCLVDEAMTTLRKLTNLRVLHAAYNCFHHLPESCITAWKHLEELVLSGNSLQTIPDNIIHLKNLSVLRLHSNQLQACPAIANLLVLRVLDLAHNQLDRINLSTLVPQQLQFLDLSCNSKLHVDSDQFQNYRTQRAMSLVDVSGQNRTSLPSTPRPFNEGGDSILEPPWKIGFSETPGNKSRLYITQLRLPAFCNTEGLFGIFDGENNNVIPSMLEKTVPRILLEERTMKETACEYMKYTMLSAHRELREKGQRHGVCATVAHICRTKDTTNTFIPSARKYVLRLASVGSIKVVLYRRTGPMCLTPASPRRQLGYSSQYPLVVPDPEVTEIHLDEDDEFIIIANKHLWEVISMEAAVEEVKAQRNAILAAKRLQDLAQSYGAEDNLSIIVIRFHLEGSGVDQLMRELRHTIRKNKQACELNTNSIISDVCQCGCCCDSQRMCAHCPQIVSKRSSSGDRSSPSGQSDQASSELTVSAKSFQNMRLNNPKTFTNGITRSTYDSQRKISAERRSCRGGVAKAVRARIEESEKRRELEESDTGLSEEQYKCWEYMLEQNTQLLFDKELNTLSTKGFKRNPRSRLSNMSLSRSSPHLAGDTQTNPSTSTPFLSKHFGSARSFNPLLNKSHSRSIGNYLNGGPHAAYFGSLQRLMPYNLEYDFAVMQERGAHDSMDFDTRMQQYWGVATTEL